MTDTAESAGPVVHEQNRRDRGEERRVPTLIEQADPDISEDANHLFNASLDAGTRRAIDIAEHDELGAEAFKQLIREAVAFNAAQAAKRRKEHRLSRNGRRKTARTPGEDTIRAPRL